MPRPKKISEVKSLLTNVAQTSHYEVKFGGLPSNLIRYLAKRSIGRRFTAEDAGLLCYSAVLPTPRLATANVTGNHMGITENIAHSRQYNTLSLEFYVDSRYRNLKFIESWIEFISSGSTNPIGIRNENPAITQNRLNYFVRMQYPEEYKSNLTKIIKFDRDYRTEIEYNFVGLFPYFISEIPVSYTSSEVMRMSVQFYYDRYIAGKVNSINERVIGNYGFRDPFVSQTDASLSSRNTLNTITRNFKDFLSEGNAPGFEGSGNEDFDYD